MRWLAVRYASADPRSLALLRIALGLLLAVDVLRRFPDLAAHYSNAGWRPNYAVFAHPLTPHLFSLHLSLSTPTAVAVLLSLQVAVSLLLCVGYRTRWMQLASALLVTSLDSRTILLENGGFVVLNLLAVWTLFLPLGRRLSVDAWLASWRGDVEGSVDDLNRRLPRDTTPVVSLAIFALIAQWAVIYFFNTVHKDGSTWHDGTAVYYFFQQDRMLTSFGGLVRHHIPFAVMRIATYAPSPSRRRWWRCCCRRCSPSGRACSPGGSPWCSTAPSRPSSISDRSRGRWCWCSSPTCPPPSGASAPRDAPSKWWSSIPSVRITWASLV
ncbi:MAG: hypothetical protein H6717_10975 [Polyangiaceae bacterium]|nr:hypothetical protein [Polyangiaceae bacterium]